MTVACLTEIDADQLDHMVLTVMKRLPFIDREEAEEGVHQGWAEVAEKERREGGLPKSPGGMIVQRAEWRILSKRKKQLREVSLDELMTADVDKPAAFEPASDEDVEAVAGDNVRLDALDADPVTRQIREAAEHGVRAVIAPRGSASRLAKYSDEQVEAVRQLRVEGLTFPQIEELTGVPAAYAPTLCRREVRAAPTAEGWSPERVTTTLASWAKANGRPPSWRDCEAEIGLPEPNTIIRYFGTFRDGLKAAGLTPAREGQRLHRWSDIEIAEVLADFYEREGRWPNRAELEADPALPGQCTIGRRLGSTSPAKWGPKVRKWLREREPDPTAEQMAIVINTWRDQHGRWPTTMDFERHRGALPYGRPLLQRRFGTTGGPPLGRAVERVLGFEVEDPDIAIRDKAGEPPPP